MTDLRIDAKVLQEMLSEAYEAGWHGSKELKQDAIDTLLAKFKDELNTIAPKVLFDWGSNYDIVGSATAIQQIVTNTYS